jgi:hypothetical protein
MRAALRLVFAASLFLAPAHAGEAAAIETVRNIAAVQAKLPWFWSPPFEALADIPYTHEVTYTRRVEDRRGKEVKPARNADGLSGWRTVRLERIALEWGSHQRCLMQDGKTPCSPEWVKELERQAGRRSALTVEDKARIDATREERRQRRRAFWTSFSSAFQFEWTGNAISFQPVVNAGAHPDSPLPAQLAGRLWFDAATHEITRLEYEVVGESGDSQLPEGSRVSIEMTKPVDGRYLPRKVITRREVDKQGRTEERIAEFTNFRRFASDTQVRFEDR